MSGTSNGFPTDPNKLMEYITTDPTEENAEFFKQPAILLPNNAYEHSDQITDLEFEFQFFQRFKFPKIQLRDISQYDDWYKELKTGLIYNNAGSILPDSDEEVNKMADYIMAEPLSDVINLEGFECYDLVTDGAKTILIALQKFVNEEKKRKNIE
ncbi:hypothetical protein WICMUC_002971 [Wickerhamomyces mucosus]|uniref:Uncharacterized protein n=1 Tax=Wickerhamomyces mucosus TaxID=1378264 RepID=A0A9P8TCY5_9ASCO|nr:hypothetical protein WICMUC_002971 [Wickerhamomyces mucosus]